MAVEDYRALNMPCDQIWYLGDAVEGKRIDRVREMVAMQVELLQPLGAPLRYVMGNHDFDPFQYEPNRPVVAPFWETAKTVPGWKTTAKLDDFYFWDSLGNHDVLFLSDHVDSGGPGGVPRWICTHGKVHRDAAAYPWGPEAYAKLREEIAARRRPIIIAGHEAFPGGNRPSELMRQLLPLPASVRIHFYGHAHIGDKVWLKEHLYRKIAYVEHQKLMQIDVASLEDQRGDEIRSVIFEIYGDGGFGVFFRDHGKRRWSEVLLSA